MYTRVLIVVLYLCSEACSANEDCGRQLNVTTQMLQEDEVTVGDQPWTVAIYYNLSSSSWNYMCAGTLITSSHVITSAYCVTDFADNARPASSVKLVAGKLHREYNNTEPGSQSRGVRAVHVHPRFNETTWWQHNIALLEADSSFQLSWRFIPACVDWTGQSLPAPTSAVVTAETRGHVFATQPYTHLPRDQCQHEAEFDSEYISNNTFCFRQASDVTCDGVLGAGLMVPHTAARGVVRYFLRGVLSAWLEHLISKDGCYYNQLIAFTALTPYTAWLQQFSNTSDPA